MKKVATVTIPRSIQLFRVFAAANARSFPRRLSHWVLKSNWVGFLHWGDSRFFIKLKENSGVSEGGTHFLTCRVNCRN